jgi:TRAP-type C4-dicarboxylate transport system permease small subunit
MLQRICSLHDRITIVGFAGAAAAVAVITGAFWYEVVARYFFSAPTIWAYDVASYAMCPMIFLAVPEMTRRGAHIRVSFLVDGLPLSYRQSWNTIILLVAVLVCLLGAWIAGAETWRQYVRGVETISAFPVRKWWVSIFIPYGLLSAALYFLRQLAGETPAARGEAEAGAEL